MPIAAYHVRGEYSTIVTGAQNGSIDLDLAKILFDSLCEGGGEEAGVRRLQTARWDLAAFTHFS